MKCQHVLQRLLATSGPRRLPDEVLAHLEGCERCRRWSGRLAEIDAAVPNLPVPDSSAAKAALIHSFLNPAAPAAEPVWAPRRLRVNWLRVLVAAAAVVVIGLAVSGVFNREKTKTPAAAQDALLARVLDRQLELAGAESIEKRVEVLDKLAGELDREALALARVAGEEDLTALTDMYVSVVNGPSGLVTRAEDVPPIERKKVLEPIAQRLKKVSEQAEQMAREVPPDAVASLKRVATTARDAHGVIQRKINEEKMAHDESPRRGEGKS